MYHLGYHVEDHLHKKISFTCANNGGYERYVLFVFNEYYCIILADKQFKVDDT